jgi:hypothetical protein
MSTQQQLNANRRNAQGSTGPRTLEGKAVSSRNALTHGLAANRAVLPGENPQDFQVLLSNLVQEFRHATELQRSLVRQLADAEWRLRRVPDFEAGLLASASTKDIVGSRITPRTGLTTKTRSMSGFAAKCSSTTLRAPTLSPSSPATSPASPATISKRSSTFARSRRHCASQRPTAPEPRTPKKKK